MQVWLITNNCFQLVLEQFDNELSRKVNEVVNEIRRQRCSYLRYHMWFFNYAVSTHCLTPPLTCSICFADWDYAKRATHLVSLQTAYFVTLYLIITSKLNARFCICRRFLPFAVGGGQGTRWTFLCRVPRTCSQADPEQDDLTWPALLLWYFGWYRSRRNWFSACGYIAKRNEAVAL